MFDDLNFWKLAIYLSLSGVLAFIVGGIIFDSASDLKKKLPSFFSEALDDKISIYLFSFSVSCLIVGLILRLATPEKESDDGRRRLVKYSVVCNGFVTQRSFPSLYKTELKNLKEIDEKSGDYPREAEALFLEGDRAFRAGRFAEAAEKFRKSSESEFTYSARLNNGLSLFFASDIDGAWKTFEDSLRIMTESGEDHKGVRTVFRTNQGIIQAARGRPDLALDSFYDALHIAEEIGSTLGRAQSHCNIGLILEQLGERRGALEHMEKALAQYQSRNMGGKGVNIVTSALHRLRKE